MIVKNKGNYITSPYNGKILNWLKHNIINPIWEIPIFYKLLQATLAAGGHDIIKKYLVKEIPRNVKFILDQGCGTGEYALLFPKRYTGLDNNPDYIKQAQLKYPGEFILGDAVNMKQIKPKSFDITFAVGLHHHLTDNQAKKAFLESIRVTKKGGRVVVVDAMWPKNSLNFLGWFFRKMDRGGNVRKVEETLILIPKGIKYTYGVISSYPFDYLTIVIDT